MSMALGRLKESGIFFDSWNTMYTTKAATVTGALFNNSGMY